MKVGDTITGISYTGKEYEGTVECIFKQINDAFYVRFKFSERACPDFGLCAVIVEETRCNLMFDVDEIASMFQALDRLIVVGHEEIIVYDPETGSWESEYIR